MSAAEKSWSHRIGHSAIHADLYSILDRLSKEDRLEFLRRAIESCPGVAMVTIITDDELHNYYVAGNREL